MAASTMRRLPRQVLDAVNRLLEEGRTIDEVTAFLQEMGAEVSRSSVGRYRKQWPRPCGIWPRCASFRARWWRN